MTDKKRPDALEADHFGERTEMAARWYMVNRDGMATLCTDKEDAEKEAADAQSVWPHMGPHRAVRLVEAADVEALRAGYAAARLEIESLRARGVAPAMGYEHQCAIMEDERRASLDAFDPDASLTRTEERLYETAFTNGWDRAMRAAQPVGAQQPTTQTAPQQEAASVDLKTMELAESVGLIGPASRTHDLHAAIQRFHDLICVNATIKAAQMAAEAIDAARAAQEGKSHDN